MENWQQAFDVSATMQFQVHFCWIKSFRRASSAKKHRSAKRRTEALAHHQRHEMVDLGLYCMPPSSLVALLRREKAGLPHQPWPCNLSVRCLKAGGKFATLAACQRQMNMVNSKSIFYVMERSHMITKERWP